jgi:hypothetical protein
MLALQLPIQKTDLMFVEEEENLGNKKVQDELVMDQHVPLSGKVEE